MRIMSGFLGATLLILTACAHQGGNPIPDLRGTWLIREEAVVSDRLPEQPPLSHHLDLVHGRRLVEIEFSLVIDTQEDFRFSGVKSSDRRREDVSGVLGFDGGEVYMADEDGIFLGRLAGADRVEFIYLHSTAHHSVASRGIMVRQP